MDDRKRHEQDERDQARKHVEGPEVKAEDAEDVIGGIGGRDSSQWTGCLSPPVVQRGRGCWTVASGACPSRRLVS
jgi:hypothetical protein